MNVIDRTVSTVTTWFNDRTPGLMPAYKKHMSEYYAPKNFNLWYYFGSLAMLVLVNQIVTGIFLTMNYKPSAAEAFASVEYALHRRITIFCGGLSAYVPCHVVWFIPKTT